MAVMKSQREAGTVQNEALFIARLHSSGDSGEENEDEKEVYITTEVLKALPIALGALEGPGRGGYQ